MERRGTRQLLLVRVGTLMCGLPMEHLSETCRPLPVKAMKSTLPYVRGVTVIRSAPAPVISLSTLLWGQPASATRFVVLRTGQGRVVLEVEEVVGVASIPSERLVDSPRVLGEAIREHVTALAEVDGELLAVLASAHLVSDDLLRTSAPPPPPGLP